MCSGYEHIGLRLASAEAVENAWAGLVGVGADVHLEELQGGDDDDRSFRFRHLLPLTIEVQHLP